jgi:hypothetical protein
MKLLTSLSLIFLTSTSPTYADDYNVRTPQIILCDMSHRLGDTWLEKENDSYILTTQYGVLSHGGMLLRDLPAHTQRHLDHLANKTTDLRQMGFTNQEFQSYINSEMFIANLAVELLNALEQQNSNTDLIVKQCPPPLIG